MQIALVLQIEITLVNVNRPPLCSTSYGPISNDTLDAYLCVPSHPLVEPVLMQAPLPPVTMSPKHRLGGPSLGETAGLQNLSKVESLYGKEKAVKRSTETGVSPLKQCSQEEQRHEIKGSRALFNHIAHCAFSICIYPMPFSFAFIITVLSALIGVALSFLLGEKESSLPLKAGLCSSAMLQGLQNALCLSGGRWD